MVQARLTGSVLCSRTPGYVVLAVRAQRDHPVGQGRHVVREAHGVTLATPAAGRQTGIARRVACWARHDLRRPRAADRSRRAGAALRAGGAGAGHGRVRDRDHRVRDHGAAARDRGRRRRLDPGCGPHDLGVRRRRGRRCPGAGLLRGTVPAPRPAARAGGVARDRQRDERGRRLVRAADRGPVLRRAAARRLLRGRLTGGGLDGHPRTPGPRGQHGDARAGGREHRRCPGGDVPRASTWAGARRTGA